MINNINPANTQVKSENSGGKTTDQRIDKYSSQYFQMINKQMEQAILFQIKLHGATHLLAAFVVKLRQFLLCLTLAIKKI